MSQIYKSPQQAVIHEIASGFFETAAIDKKTMREFDESCLAKPIPLTPDDIRNIRIRENVSQPVFARYVNVSKGLLSDWERGVKKPGGPALRLLTIIQKKGLSAVIS